MEPLEPELELGLLELEPGPKLEPEFEPEPLELGLGPLEPELELGLLELEPGLKMKPELEPDLVLVPKLEPELVFGFRHALPYLVLLPSFPFRYPKYFSRQE